jgi:hypothetical protein
MAITGVTLRVVKGDKLTIEEMDGNFSAITSSIEFRATTASNQFNGNQSISGSLIVSGNISFGLTSSVNNLHVTGVFAQLKVDSGNGPAAVLLGSVTASNYPTDYTAENQGVPLGGVYHTDGYLKIRTSDTDRTAFNLTSISASNYVDDAAAAAGNINLGGMYHTNGTLKIRLV